MNLVKRLARLVLGARLPRHEGTLKVTGAHGRIVIQRDRFGVPSIDAVDGWDAWFGLGFCHAQDRMGQLEITQRVIRGTLSEVIGPDALPVDRLTRRMGIRHAGIAQLAAFDADMRAQQEAYAAGINAGLAASKRSHEHALLGIRPSPWEAADAQGLCAFLCFGLAANWDMELARWEIARTHGLDALHALDPLPADWLHTTLPPEGTPDKAGLAAAVARFRDDARTTAEVLGLAGGSNAWALAPAKTATGRPILAGDPHLPPQSPNPFYLVRMQCPEFLAIGATFVGVGAIGSGHNGHLAWGITAAHLDVTDWFVERIGPDGRSVQRGDAFEPCRVRREVIRVKGRPDHVEEVLETSHGPIVGPALDLAGSESLALAATWLAPRPYRGLLGIHQCRRAADVRACFAQAATTNIGLVFADAEGHIGWLLAAEVPVRKHGTGPLPQPGWDPRYGWDGLVPPDALPHVIDPPQGFLAAANNTPTAAVDADAAPFLGLDFLDGYRVTAIARALAARGEWDVSETARLQLDTRSLPWEEMRAVVLAAAREGPGKRFIQEWDGRMDADSPGAALYAHLVAELCRRVVRAKAPNAEAVALGKGATAFLPYNLLFARRTSHLVRLLSAQPDGWMEREGGWPETIASALEAAWDHLARRFGADPTGWAWGRIRPLRLKHPFGIKKPLDRLFDLGPYPMGGDATTIPQAAVDLADPTANPIGVPAFRMVIDVGDWDRSRFALLGGQSGNPFSLNAEDQVARWAANDGVPIHASREARARVVTATLVLEVAP